MIRQTLFYGETMEVTLKKMGNSTALVLPPPVLRDLGIGIGQKMTLTTTADGQITLSPKRHYVLAEMIARCNLKAPPPADMALWDRARPVGQEVF
jgi:antitoxin ChpS